jgi:transcriptional regulator with PAS, ATPase and Fis domain
METKSLINLLNFQATLIDSAAIKFLWYEKFLIPPDDIDKIHQQTLVLHEQDLPKLLRVLEENEIRRVGGTAQIHTDVRVVVSTNRNLEKAVKTGTFRSDLYERLKPLHIFMPPLRQRRVDIPALVEHFLGKNNQFQSQKRGSISPQALALLQGYD